MNEVDFAIDILSGACAKCYNYHDGDCIAVDAETLRKLYENSYFKNAFETFLVPPKQENLKGTYMGRPVYLKRTIYENTNSR